MCIFLRKSVLDTIDTGLKSQNICQQIKHLTTFDPLVCVTDDDILDAVSEAESYEEERQRKMAEKKSNAIDVCSLQKKEKADKAEANKKNDLQARLSKQENDIAVLTANVCELTSSFKQFMSSGPNQPGAFNTPDGNNSNVGGGGGAGAQFGIGRGRGRRDMGGYRRRGSPRCRQCVSANNPGRCNHCFRCSSTEHKVGECDVPLNEL